jgi:hypothetical protein
MANNDGSGASKASRAEGNRHVLQNAVERRRGMRLPARLVAVAWRDLLVIGVPVAQVDKKPAGLVGNAVPARMKVKLKGPSQWRALFVFAVAAESRPMAGRFLRSTQARTRPSVSRHVDTVPASDVPSQHRIHDRGKRR